MEIAKRLIHTSWYKWVFVAAAVWSMISVLGVRPLVMGDELRFSTWIRHTSFAEQPLPDYLYSLVYKSTLLCGDGFYSCVKFENWLFSVGAAGLLVALGLYLGLSSNYAWLLGAAILASPQAIRSSFFMPDAMYYFMATLVVYVAFRAWSEKMRYGWLYIGLVLGLTILTKPHGWILAAGLLGSYVIVYLGKSRFLDLVKHAALILGVAVLVRFSIGFALAGTASLTVFGSYGGRLDTVVSDSLSGSQETLIPIEQVNEWALAALTTYVLGALLLTPGLVGALLQPASNGSAGVNDSKGDPNILLRLLGVLYLSQAFAFAAFVWYAASGGESFEDRVIFRYVEFLIPAIVVGIIASYQSSKPLRFNPLSFVVVFGSTGLAVLALVVFRDGVNIRYADSAFTWLFANYEFLIIAVLIVTLVAFMQFLGVQNVVRRIVTWSIIILLPALGIYSGVQLNTLTGNLDSESKAAEAIQSWYRFIESEDVLIVASSKASAEYIKFIADLPDAEIVWTDNAGIGAYDFQTEDAWVLNTSNASLDPTGSFRMVGPGYSIERISEHQEHFFNIDMRSSPVKEVQGISSYSDNFVWASEPVVISLEDRLSAGSAIQLAITSSSSSPSQPMSLTVGEEEFNFELPAEPGSLAVVAFNIGSASAGDRIVLQGRDNPELDFGLSFLRIKD